MPILPDIKDWTWVLARRCPECGCDASALPGTAVADAVISTLPRWSAALARPDAADRPDDATWSVLEYGAHVRDVSRITDARLRLLLTQDDPVFENWDQDATAVEQDYAHQQAARVDDELRAAARSLAMHLAAVVPGAWARAGTRSNGSVFTVDSLVRYMFHDVAHHLHDVRA